MRERHVGRFDHAAPVGITPAYAGKTYQASTNEVVAQDHPRVCGKDIIPVISVFRWFGITPAYAGKTF